MWDVWIHILEIAAECACWGDGRPSVPPLRQKRGKPGRRAESSRPTKGVAGTCSLIRPLRGHLSLSPLSLRDIIPTPFGLRPFPTDRGNRPIDKGRCPQGKARAGHRPAPASNLKAVPFYCRGRSQTGPQMYAARRGRRALQPSTSRHLLSQARRSCGIAPTSILGMPGPNGPAEI